MAHPIPAGYHAITPAPGDQGGLRGDRVLQAGLRRGGALPHALPGPDGRVKIGHAELQIGDSELFLADEFPELRRRSAPTGSSPVTIHLYVTDADATFARAVEAGATVRMPLADMFWGDRYGKLVDPFGHHWSIAEHLEDLTPEQMQERMAAAMAGAPCE